jgi:acyl-coenzyme A thioesterase PaaI-like protein
MAKLQIPSQVAPDLLDRLRARFAPFPLIQGWNVVLEAVEPGKAVLSQGPSDAVVNVPGDTVNGGVLATLADMACAVALSTVFDGAMPFVTSDMHVRYLEPAEGKVMVKASLIRFSARSAILECWLRCGSQDVALCTTHFVIQLPKAK